MSNEESLACAMARRLLTTLAYLQAFSALEQIGQEKATGVVEEYSSGMINITKIALNL